jgi:hypothetical protein
LHVVADGANSKLVFDIKQRLRQAFGGFPVIAQDMKSEPLRGFLSDARQAFEFLNQTGERFGEVRHRGVGLEIPA